MGDSIKEHQNTGVIIVPPTPTDFIAGVQSAIVYQENIASGDWTEYLPDGESQSGVYMDAMDCVSQYAAHSVETQLNWKLRMGRLSGFQMRWLVANGYMTINGRIKLSVRFLAKVSGTTSNGNTAQAVADAFRHYGAVPDADWPYPNTQRTPPFTWADFYVDVPQEILDKGQKFLEIMGDGDPTNVIQYEIIQHDEFAAVQPITYHLRQAPLGLFVHVCPTWNTGDVAYCGVDTAGHAIELYKEDDKHRIFDSYDPYQKSLAADYALPFIFKVIINTKTMYTLYQSPHKAGEIYAFLPGNTAKRHVGGLYDLREGRAGGEFTYTDEAIIPVCDVALFDATPERAELEFHPNDAQAGV